METPKEDGLMEELNEAADSPSAGSVSDLDATSETLLEYIKQDIETMNREQIAKTYKAVRRIVAGLK